LYHQTKTSFNHLKNYLKISDALLSKAHGFLKYIKEKDDPLKLVVFLKNTTLYSLLHIYTKFYATAYHILGVI